MSTMVDRFETKLNAQKTKEEQSMCNHILPATIGMQIVDILVCVVK